MQIPPHERQMQAAHARGHSHDCPTVDRRTIQLVAVCVFSVAGLSALAAEPQRETSLLPHQSLAQIVVQPGYRVELIVAEPLVVDPVEVALDDAGRMWVVEMRDYPFAQTDKPRGRVRVLTDEDDDGSFDTAHEFATGLDMPTGLALYKGGALITVAGQLLWLKDSDGDWKADQRAVWLEGFSQDNEQLRANHPRFGPDGQLYIASGLRGGSVQVGSGVAAQSSGSTLAAAEQPIELGSRDMRLDLGRGRLQAVTGPAQFGLCFDFAGRRHLCSNRNPARRVVFEAEDLTDNPLAALATLVVDTLPAGASSEVHPIVEAWTTSNLHAGQFTAACGVYLSGPLRTADSVRGGKQELLEETFVCEPTGSLVKRQAKVLHATGETVVSASWNIEHDWLASRDPWFRPVNLCSSPDGAILIVDMHRAVIEHPHWVPDELKRRKDERWGDDCGRIYWAGSETAVGLSQLLRQLSSRPLSQREDLELVNLLGHPSQWFRETATRLLLERTTSVPLAAEATERLKGIANDAAAEVRVKIASLQLLSLIDAPAALKLISNAPTNDSAAYRLAALRVAQTLLRSTRYIEQSGVPHLAESCRPLVECCFSLVDDQNPQVRLEALLCLALLRQECDGDSIDPLALERWLERIAAGGHTQELVALAGAMRDEPQRLLVALTSVVQRADAMAQIAKPVTESVTDRLSELLKAAELLARSQSDSERRRECASLLCDLLLEATERESRSGQAIALSALFGIVSGAPDLATNQLTENVWQCARNLVRQVVDRPSLGATTSMAAQQACRLLGQNSDAESAELLATVARTCAEPAVQQAALVAWSNQHDDACDLYLLELVGGGAPQARTLALSLCRKNTRRLALLAEALTDNRISARQIGAAGLKQLASSSSGSTARTFQSSLESIVQTDRRAVLERYKRCLELPADLARGREVFRQHCAACHRIDQIGRAIGPDISDSRTKQPLEILTAVIDPNLAIDNNYFRYVVLLTDGQVLDGIIAGETSESVTLIDPTAQKVVIARDDIEAIKATGLSLMPDGLESQIDLQSMADLIGFIKNWRYESGIVPVDKR